MSPLFHLEFTGYSGETLTVDYSFTTPEAAALFATEVITPRPERCVLYTPAGAEVPATQADLARGFVVVGG